MQWGQIKTIFIICFLLLDIYLVVQIIDTDNEAETGEMFLPDTTSLQDELQERNIIYENLPETTPKAAYISASWHSFTDEELEPLENQEIMNNTDMVYSQFIEPIPLKKDGSDIVQLVSENILYSDRYTYYHLNEDKNILIFFQHYNKQPIYYNNGGMLMVFLNENFEMTSYAQTMQEDIKTQIEEKEVSKPIEIVGVLLENNQLFSGDEIAEMELGYHTFFPFENGMQAFVPTWKVTVKTANGSRIHFVNALDGQIITKDEEKFISDIRERVQEVKSKPGE
jgi:regulatory protein YycI of two-component signal transduction system YycFG